MWLFFFFFFSSRRRHTRFDCAWSSDVCSSDLLIRAAKKKGGDHWNGERLKAALQEIRKFPSVYGGAVGFQEDGTSLKRVALFEVKGEKPTFKKFIDIKK